MISRMPTSGHFMDNVQCSCHSCATISVTRIDERDETEYGMGLQLDASQQPEQLNPPITHVSSWDEDDQRVIHSDAMQLDHAVDPEISSAQAGSQSAKAAPIICCINDRNALTRNMFLRCHPHFVLMHHVKATPYFEVPAEPEVQAHSPFPFLPLRAHISRSERTELAMAYTRSGRRDFGTWSCRYFSAKYFS